MPKSKLIMVLRGIICLLPLILQSYQSVNAQTEQIKSYYEQADLASEQTSITFVQPSMNLVKDFSHLEQIILIRHGEPDLLKKGWFKRKEAMQFIKDYDSVGVAPLSYLPVLLKQDEVKTIHTSSLNRAKHTARLIFGPEFTYQEDRRFREFERKIFSFPNLKMPLKFWLVNSRIFWLMGLNKKNIESFKQAKRRAKKASQKLSEYAAQDKKVVLVAHGFLNRYLIKYLKKQGWTLARNGGSEYLAASLLVRLRE